MKERWTSDISFSEIRHWQNLLENTLDECSKLKNMSDERLGYLTKSLLSQNFYRTMPDALKTRFTPWLFYFKLTVCANQLCIIATRIMVFIDTWINKKVWDAITLRSLLFLWRWKKTVNNCICKVAQTYFRSVRIHFSWWTSKFHSKSPKASCMSFRWNF